MSKVYALSGMRSAYLCSCGSILERLRLISPPWAVSLPAQIAGVKAIEDHAYYKDKFDLTHQYRNELVQKLKSKIERYLTCFST